MCRLWPWCFSGHISCSSSQKYWEAYHTLILCILSFSTLLPSEQLKVYNFFFLLHCKRILVELHHHQEVHPNQRYWNHNYIPFFSLNNIILIYVTFLYEHNFGSYLHSHRLMLFLLILYPQLDTLSKDDLIKYAKKQIAAMQKMKGRCAGNVCEWFYHSVAVRGQKWHVTWHYLSFQTWKKKLNPWNNSPKTITVV